MEAVVQKTHDARALAARAFAFAVAEATSDAGSTGTKIKLVAPRALVGGEQPRFHFRGEDGLSKCRLRLDLKGAGHQTRKEVPEKWVAGIICGFCRELLSREQPAEAARLPPGEADE